jgi:2-keto-4-pentenoate hydratase
LSSLIWLANTLCEQGKAIKAGDLVSTGVCTDIYLAELYDHIVADFGTLGTVEVSFLWIMRFGGQMVLAFMSDYLKKYA